MKKLLLITIVCISVMITFSSFRRSPGGAGSDNNYTVNKPTPTTDLSPVTNYISKYNSGAHAVFATSYVLPLDIAGFFQTYSYNFKIINALNTSNRNSPIVIIVPTDANNNAVWTSVPYQASNGAKGSFPVYCNVATADAVNGGQLTLAKINDADIMASPIDANTAKADIAAYTKVASSVGTYSNPYTSITISINRTSLPALPANAAFPYIRIFNGLASNNARVMVVIASTADGKINTNTAYQFDNSALCPTNCDIY